MTLLETLVTLAILALVGAVSVVQLDRVMGLYALREARSAMGAHLKAAHAVALRQDQPVTFAVSGDGRSYAWTGGVPQMLPGGVAALQSDPSGVVFYGDGSVAATDLAVQSRRGRYTVSVDPATGAIGTP